MTLSLNLMTCIKNLIGYKSNPVLIRSGASLSHIYIYTSLLSLQRYLNISDVVYDFSDTENRAQYIEEERLMREENIRLQRKLQREVERREALCRQLSESESSLEMDDERYRDSDLNK